MRRACIFSAGEFLRHGSPGHLENYRRLEAILAGLKSAGLMHRLDVIRPCEASVKQLCEAHDPAYVSYIETFGTGKLDPDTEMTAGSLEASMLAAGAAVGAVDEVRGGRELAFGLVRPPGHHALPGRAMGFCIFNNAAVGAAHALPFFKKVLVVDWDVHHGNGTERIFYESPDVLYFSVHQSPHFPYTGRAEDTGEGEGRGFNVNVPLPPGSTDADYIEAFRRVLVPIADDFKPGIVIVSAGYDPAEGDPLGDMRMTSRGFRKLAFIVRGLGRAPGVAVLLEGGYSALLSECVSASIEGFLGRDAAIDPGPRPAAEACIAEAALAQKPYWRL